MEPKCYAFRFGDEGHPKHQNMTIDSYGFQKGILFTLGFQKRFCVPSFMSTAKTPPIISNKKRNDTPRICVQRFVEFNVISHQHVFYVPPPKV